MQPLALETAITRMFGLRAPILVGPMTAVSEENLVVAAAEAGVLAGLPPHNYRRVDEFAAALGRIRARTKGPFAVNLIVNRANLLLTRQLDAALEAKAPVFVCSLGDPKDVIAAAHRAGAKVICDVSTVAHGERAQAAGADAVNAVVAGAGGHCGQLSGFTLVPSLVDRLSIPVVCAGAVADGRGLAAALMLGASAVQMGTRFIASTECEATPGWKDAIVAASADDLVLTQRLSGVTGSYLPTEELARVGSALPLPLALLMRSARTRGITRKAMMVLASRKMGEVQRGERALWSAGQSAGLVHDVAPVAAIVARVVEECRAAMAAHYKQTQ